MQLSNQLRGELFVLRVDSKEYRDPAFKDPSNNVRVHCFLARLRVHYKAFPKLMEILGAAGTSSLNHSI